MNQVVVDDWLVDLIFARFIELLEPLRSRLVLVKEHRVLIIRVLAAVSGG